MGEVAVALLLLPEPPEEEDELELLELLLTLGAAPPVPPGGVKPGAIKLGGVKLGRGRAWEGEAKVITMLPTMQRYKAPLCDELIIAISLLIEIKASRKFWI